MMAKASRSLRPTPTSESGGTVVVEHHPGHLEPQHLADDLAVRRSPRRPPGARARRRTRGPAAGGASGGSCGVGRGRDEQRPGRSARPAAARRRPPPGGPADRRGRRPPGAGRDRRSSGRCPGHGRAQGSFRVFVGQHPALRSRSTPPPALPVAPPGRRPPGTGPVGATRARRSRPRTRSTGRHSRSGRRAWLPAERRDAPRSAPPHGRSGVSGGLGLAPAVAALERSMRPPVSTSFCLPV